MATFSWGDTARAAFATCFACFPQYQQSTEDNDNNNNNNNQGNANRDRDELESLLRNAEHSDGEMDTDAVSLHSNVGNPRRKDFKRQKQRRRRRKHNSKGTIRLFGYDLFGKPAVGQTAEGYSDDGDDGDDDDGDNDDSERRRISRLSSSTLDSDPMPVEDDTIARLSAGRTRRPSQSQSQSRVEVAQPSQTQDEEASAAATARKAARKEKRRQRKLSSALLNAEQSVEFQGFQGSGGDGDDASSSHAVLNSVATGTLSSSSPSSSSGLPLQEEFGAFQEAKQPYHLNNVTLNSPSRTTGDAFVRVSSRNDVEEDEADNNADFDAVAYIRRNSVASRSDSGSGSRSHTSVSMSRSEGMESARIRESQSQLHGLRSPSLLHDPRQHPLSPSDLVSASIDKPSKRTRRSTTSGLDGTDQQTSPSLSSSSRKPRRSRRSTTAGSTSGTSSSTTTTTMSSSQPRSPDSLPTSDLRIVQPSDHHNHNHNHNHNHLRPPQHSPAFEGVPEDDGEFTGSPLPSPFRSPASDLSKGLPSPGLSTATLEGGSNGFPSVGFGGRRNSSATASSGAFLARTGDDS